MERGENRTSAYGVRRRYFWSEGALSQRPFELRTGQRRERLPANSRLQFSAGRYLRDCVAKSSIPFALRALGCENRGQHHDGFLPPTDGSSPLRCCSTRDSRYSKGRRRGKNDARDKPCPTPKMPARRPARMN